MKIIAWNCNMAFRKKAEFILTDQIDILIISECESPEKLIFKDELMKPTDLFWFGENPNKGIGIFSYSNFKIELLSIHNPKFKYVIPLSVSNNEINLTIFAIWAQKPEKHNCYTEQVWNAVHFYSELLDNDNVILAGDFNSSAIWDKPNRVYNHTNLVNFLKSKNINSVYHLYRNEEQGKETSPTLFMHRKVERPYHIDFCFVSNNLMKKLKNIEIGEYKNWTTHSDHMPLSVTFEL